MRLVIVRRREERLVGGDDRQAVAVGERDQLALDQPLLLQPVALDLDVELMAEGVLEDVEPRLRQILAAAVAQRAVEGAREAARQRDEPLAMSRESAGAATRGASPSGTPK